MADSNDPLKDLIPTPINALFAADGIDPNPQLGDEPHLLIEEADLIFGIDVMSRNRFLVYGREILERVNESGVEEDVKIIIIELDQGEESDDLERLCALVEVVKGHHDYRGFGQA